MKVRLCHVERFHFALHGACQQRQTLGARRERRVAVFLFELGATRHRDDDFNLTGGVLRQTPNTRRQVRVANSCAICVFFSSSFSRTAD
jgi:hypothetical protein